MDVTANARRDRLNEDCSERYLIRVIREPDWSMFDHEILKARKAKCQRGLSCFRAFEINTFEINNCKGR